MNNRTINIRLPGGTNVDELINMYANLCVARGIPNVLPVTGTSNGFNHPIQESRQILLDDFMTMSELFARLTIEYNTVSVTGARVYHNMVTFIIQTGEETTHVLFPEQH